MSPGEQFVAGAIVLIFAALFIACAIGSAAGWWAGLNDRAEMPPVDLDADEYRSRIPRQRDRRRE